MAAPIGALRAEMSAGHAQFERDMGKARAAVQKNGRQMETAMNKVGASFTSTIKTIASIGAAYLAVNKAWDYAEQAAKYEQSRQAFNSMAEGMGADAEKVFERVRKLSGGLIDDNALIESMNKAISLGIPIEKLGDLMLIARAKSRDMGITTTQAFNDIATGIGRGSPLILDNLGLVMKVGTANEQMAASLGKTVQELTDKEKKMAILNATLDAGKEALSRHNLEVLTDKERMDSLGVSTANLGIELGKLVKGFANQVMKEFLPTLENLTDKMVKSAKETDGLGTSAKTAATGLRLLFSAGAIISGVFKTIGEYIGGAAAALVSLATGDFRQAMTIMSDTGWDLVDNVRGTVDNIKIIWDDTANDIEAMAPETGKKLAAPIIETTKQIKSEISSQKALLADWDISQKALLADWDILNDYAKKTGQILSEIKTPVEKFNETMQELRILLKLGYIDFEIFQRAARKAAQEWKSSGDEIDDQFGELKQAIDGWGKDAAGTFADFAMSGKASFKDLVDSIIRDIIKMSAYKAIFKPLFGGIENLIPSIAFGFHGGGIVGRDASFIRPVDPGIFSSAPRLHSGLMPDEFPAILQKGEAVIPKDAVGGGAGDTNVFIYAVDAKSFEDMCRRNPGAINSQVLQSLRDNKTRSEIKSLLR